MRLAPALRVLHGRRVLLQGVAREGRLFRLNNMVFEGVLGVDSSGHQIIKEVGHSEEENYFLDPPAEPRAGLVVVNENLLTIFDAFVSHTHLQLGRIGGRKNPYSFERLTATKPWKERDGDDYLAPQDYDHRLQQLATELRPELRAQAAERIALRKTLLEQARIEEEARVRAEAEEFAALVTREDLGEDNASWGSW